jgi:hypothetical protein
MAFTAKNIITGVVCIVVVSLLFAALQTYAYDPPLPVWLEQAIISLIAILVWFFIAARLNR